MSSDKEVTNCLARRAPGRPRDVLGTKPGAAGPTGWTRRGSLPKDDDGLALALRSIVTCENNANEPSKLDPDDRRIYRRAIANPGNELARLAAIFENSDSAPQPGIRGLLAPRNPLYRKTSKALSIRNAECLWVAFYLSSSLSPEFKWNST